MARLHSSASPPDKKEPLHDAVSHPQNLLPPILLPKLMRPEPAEMLPLARLVDLDGRCVSKTPPLKTDPGKKKEKQERDHKKTHHPHLPRRKLKRHRPQVIAQPLLLRARRDRHDVLLHAPPQTHLAGADGVLLRERSENLVHGPRRGLRHGRQGRVRGGRDVLRPKKKTCQSGEWAFLGEGKRTCSLWYLSSSLCCR